MDRDEERRIIAQVCAGDTNAFEALVVAYQKQVYNLALRTVGNEEDAEKVFGIKAHNTDVTSASLSHEGYKDVAKQLTDRFGFKSVAITLRGSISASDNTWAAMLFTGGEYYFSREYPVHIVDRVGGGDSFAGGLIYAMLNKMGAQDTLEFAVANSCLKHSVEGDHNHVTLAEVRALMAGDASGRVQR